MTISDLGKRSALLLVGAALAAALATGCSPRTEEPATSTAPSVTPTEKGAKGVQDPVVTPSVPTPSSVMGPDGTMNRSGGRPDTNDNGGWSQSASPGTTADPMQPPIGNN